MNKQILEQLYTPFDVKERQGQGNRRFSYIPSKDIFDRMNKVFMGNWSVDVIDKEIIEDNVLVHVRVSVHDPNDETTSNMYWQDGFASHQVFRYTSGPNNGKVIDIGNSYRSAMSKAIKAACARWGAGLYLEDEDHGNDQGMGVFNNTTPSSNPSPSTPAPSTPPAQDNSIPAFPGTPPAPSTPAPEAGQSGPQPSFPGTPAAPVESTPVPPAPQAPPTQSVPESPAPTNSGPFPPPSMYDSTPAAPAQPQGGGFEQPPAAPFAGGGEERLTDVQRVAIETTLSAHKMSYEDLAKKALGREDSIPGIDELTYKDAVKLIQYGNNLNG